MKNKRKSILQTIQETEDGYRYTGESFRIMRKEDQRGGPLGKLMVFCILTALTVIFSGSIDTRAAFGAFYVILPYVGEVSALFMMVWNLVRLVYNRDNLRAYVLDHIRSRIPGAATALCLCALVGLAFSLLYLFRNGSGGQPAAGILYLVCKGLAAVLALGCRKAFLDLKWEKV